MKNIRVFLLLSLCLSSNNIFGQNEEVKRTDIISSLIHFFDNLSSVNDEYDSMPASEFVRIYGNENALTGGGHYFRYNGQETDMTSFIQYYAKSSIEGRNINHKLDIYNRTINVRPVDKVSSTDQRWIVKGRLQRANADFETSDKNEDYLIKDEPIDLVVRYNGHEKEISILEINIKNLRLQKVFPVYRTQIVFLPVRNNTSMNLSAAGGEWSCQMQSYSARIKEYPGFDKTSETRTPLGFTYSLGDQRSSIKIGNIKVDNESIKGTVSQNFLKKSRSSTINLIQNETNKIYSVTIFQSGAVKPCKWCDFFDVDDYHNLSQIGLSYSLKYGVGLIYKYHFEDTRFSLGGLVATNFDTYRGWKKLDDEEPSLPVDNSSTSIGLNKDLYEISREIVIPETSNYSSILDPRNEAKKYTARSLFLIQPGVNVTNWCNFTLGIGVALSHNKYFMETAYGYTKYSFTKLDPSLPDIDDIYDYRAYYKNYYYKDPIKCHFAIRPSLDFRIPVERHQYINLEVGYVLTPGCKDGASLDFAIGYTWDY